MRYSFANQVVFAPSYFYELVPIDHLKPETITRSHNRCKIPKAKAYVKAQKDCANNDRVSTIRGRIDKFRTEKWASETLSVFGDIQTQPFSDCKWWLPRLWSEVSYLFSWAARAATGRWSRLQIYLIIISLEHIHALSTHIRVNEWMNTIANRPWRNTKK